MRKRLISLLFLLLLVPSLFLTAFAQGPAVVDNADLLTDEEESELTRKAQWIRDEYNMDVVILTENTLNGQSTASYADNYYDSNGYGTDESGSGVLLILVMDTREWYISTCGESRYAVSDSDVYDLFDWMSQDLSNGAYYYAFDAYLDGLMGYYRDYRNSSNSGGGYDGNSQQIYEETDGMEFGEILMSLLIGLVAGGIGLLILRSMMNTKRPQRAAADYLERNTYHLKVQRNMFLYSRVSKVPRPKDTGGSRAGGGGGGRSHGGGGGRF